MLIPKELIQDIKDRNDIVEIISSYVNLKRAGSNYNGLCPYHSEKTPSFTVFGAEQNFYCFGCGAGGDVFTFVMKSENLDYPSALEFLARRVGITISVDEQSKERAMSRKRVFQMNLDAAKFFRNCLFDPEKGRVGMEYLVNERRLSPLIIKRFGIGFAPNGFGELTNHMRSLGYREEELMEAFLCGKSQKTGRAYDYFRNRIIFPIIDVTGNVIAFGGRVMDDSKPKYLNSSDTPGFKKSKNLFALNYAKNHSSEQLILCEGYMDVIALHAAGFENAVATLGTAITGDQARMMTKYTKKVIVSYDSDEAGQRAATKAIRMLREVGIDVNILKMTGAKDPDEFIVKYGADEFRRILKNSRTGFEYKFEGVLAKYDTTITDQKIKASNEMVEYIASIFSGVERDVYITSVAQKLDINRQSIANDVDFARKKLIKEYKNKETQDAKKSAFGVGDIVSVNRAKNIRATAAQDAIIGLMLGYEENRNPKILEKYGLSKDSFSSEFHRNVYEKIMEIQAQEEEFSVSYLGQYFSAEEMGQIQRMERARKMLTQNGVEVLMECIKTLNHEMQFEKNQDSGNSVDDIMKILQSKKK